MPALTNLPVRPTLRRKAKLEDALSQGEGWRFEPKWEGSRVLIFRYSEEVELQSKTASGARRWRVRRRRGSCCSSASMDGEDLIDARLRSEGIKVDPPRQLLHLGNFAMTDRGS